MENLNEKPAMDKKWVLEGLKEGTKILLMNGEQTEYVRTKQKKFIGIMDGKMYNIPISMFKEVIKESKSKKDLLKEIQEKQKKIDDENKRNEAVLKSLKKGDYFYISKGQRQDAILFIFDSFSNAKIVGINPITKIRTKIDNGFDFYKL